MADLDELVEKHVLAASENEHQRSAELVVHDGALRQTIIALMEGAVLPPHNSPPAASLLVLAGTVRVELADETQGEFEPGELWALTHEKHSVRALTDCAFLLTTVTGIGHDSHS